MVKRRVHEIEKRGGCQGMIVVVDSTDFCGRGWWRRGKRMIWEGEEEGREGEISLLVDWSDCLGRMWRYTILRCSDSSLSADV